MGYLYFARHGQTVWNVENKICGATDIELTELGHQQAEELGQAILEQGIQIMGFSLLSEMEFFAVPKNGISLNI